MDQIAGEFSLQTSVLAPVFAHELFRARELARALASGAPAPGEDCGTASVTVTVYAAGGGQDFSEQNSTHSVIDLTPEPLVVRVPAPQPAHAIERLRLDPADKRGAMFLHQLAVLDESGKSLWRWDGRAEMLGDGFGLACASAPDRGGALIEFLNSDPQFILPTQNLAGHERLTVELTISQAPPAAIEATRRAAGARLAEAERAAGQFAETVGRLEARAHAATAERRALAEFSDFGTALPGRAYNGARSRL